MADFLASAFCFYMIWLWCKYISLCDYPCLNRRFHITIRGRVLDRVLLCHPPRRVNEWSRYLMGIDGIISYVTLIPSAVYLWVRDGSFLFFDPTGRVIAWWFVVLFFGEVGLFTLDFWLGYFLLWRKGKKAEKRNNEKPQDTE